MDAFRAARLAASYGTRHLLQEVDAPLGRGLARPDRVMLIPTWRCNARCRMCDFWKGERRGPELPPERWLALLDELHAWLGHFHLCVTGGEPLLARGFWEIAEHAAELGLAVNPITNGLAFRREETLERLLASPLRAITFSLDGPLPEVHDAGRGVVGSHATTVAAIRRIRQERPDLVVSAICIVMEETVREIPRFILWAEELGISHLLFQPIASTTGRAGPREVGPAVGVSCVRDRDALERALEALGQARRGSGLVDLSDRDLAWIRGAFFRPESLGNGGRSCRLGQTDLRFAPGGEVFLCDLEETQLGTLGEAPVRAIWSGARAREVRRAIRRCERPCTALCHRSPTLLEKVVLFRRYLRSGKL